VLRGEIWSYVPQGSPRQPLVVIVSSDGINQSARTWLLGTPISPDDPQDILAVQVEGRGWLSAGNVTRALPRLAPRARRCARRAHRRAPQLGTASRTRPLIKQPSPSPPPSFLCSSSELAVHQVMKTSGEPFFPGHVSSQVQGAHWVCRKWSRVVRRRAGSATPRCGSSCGTARFESDEAARFLIVILPWVPIASGGRAIVSGPSTRSREASVGSDHLRAVSACYLPRLNWRYVGRVGLEPTT